MSMCSEPVIEIIDLFNISYTKKFELVDIDVSCDEFLMIFFAV